MGYFRLVSALARENIVRHRTCVGVGYSSLRHSCELSLLPSGWLQRLSRLAAIWTRGAPRRYYLHRVRSAYPRIHEFVLRSAPVRYRSRAISARRERVVIPSRRVCAFSILPRAFPLQVAGEHQFPHPSSLIPHLEMSGVGIMHSPIRPSTTQTIPL